jgi:5-formyltetrahydrofolate cyclo-ligase
MPDIPTTQHSQPVSLDTDKTPSTDIRKLKRSQRQALSTEEQLQHSVAMCDILIKQRNYRNSQHIACYLANDGEIDPYLLIEHAWFAKKDVYLPVLSPIKDSLYFAPYDINSEFKLNRFDIAEPICHPSDWVKAHQLDLILLPLVAFDLAGNRVGMGGGFYDRTLAYLQHRRHWRKPSLLGLAHEIQKADNLHRQNWDIPLNGIITEEKYYAAETSNSTTMG